MELDLERICGVMLETGLVRGLNRGLGRGLGRGLVCEEEECGVGVGSRAWMRRRARHRFR